MAMRFDLSLVPPFVIAIRDLLAPEPVFLVGGIVRDSVAAARQAGRSSGRAGYRVPGAAARREDGETVGGDGAAALLCGATAGAVCQRPRE